MTMPKNALIVERGEALFHHLEDTLFDEIDNFYTDDIAPSEVRHILMEVLAIGYRKSVDEIDQIVKDYFEGATDDES